MNDRERSLREEIEKRLLSLDNKLPTSSLGRLGRTALAGLRGARVAMRRKGTADDTRDVESLIALAASVGQLKGLAMKAGQLMSYLELQLPPEIQSALAVLQTHSPSMPFDRVVDIVKAELGERAPALLGPMGAAPVAAASIGQVHRSTLPSGETVAVKIQYPGIEDAIASDFRPAALGTPFANLLAPGANVNAVVNEARPALLDECDYVAGGTLPRALCGHLCRSRDHHRAAGSHALLFEARAHDDLDRRRFADFLAANPPQSERDRFGEAIFEFYVGTLLRHGLFNWDPHPGNYIFHRDGRIAMLDHGSTREFDHAFVQRRIALTRAVHVDKRDALHEALADLGFVKSGQRYDFETARRLVRSFYGPMLRDEKVRIEPGEAKPFGAVLESKRELLKLHLPGEFIFILRIRFGVMSVLSRLGACANWYRLERQFAEG